MWLTIFDICLWLQTSNSPGATFRSPTTASAPWGSRRAISRGQLLEEIQLVVELRDSPSGPACRRRRGCRSSGSRPRRPWPRRSGRGLSRQTSSGAASSIGRREAMATPCQPFWPAILMCGRPTSSKACTRELALLALDLLHAHDVRGLLVGETSDLLGAQALGVDVPRRHPQLHEAEFRVGSSRTSKGPAGARPAEISPATRG